MQMTTSVLARSPATTPQVGHLACPPQRRRHARTSPSRPPAPIARAPVVDYVRQAQQAGRPVVVLILEIQPRRWRYRILQNQRGLLATVLHAGTDVVICTIPYRLTTR